MQSPWRLEPRRATLRLGTLEGAIDLSQPALGLAELRLSGGALVAMQLLGVELPSSDAQGDRLVEAYLRGDDLVATYAEPGFTSPAGGSSAFRWQVYWRACAARFPRALAAIETIVSVQTGLLDSWPQLTLRSTIPAAEVAVWRIDAGRNDCNCERIAPGVATTTISAAEGWGCFGFRLAGSSACYLETIHPADFDSSAVASAPANRFALRHTLFRERLEKGVILRSRALGLVLPDWPTSAAIAEIHAALADEALPLTA